MKTICKILSAVTAFAVCGTNSMLKSKAYETEIRNDHVYIYTEPTDTEPIEVRVGSHRMSPVTTLDYITAEPDEWGLDDLFIFTPNGDYVVIELKPSGKFDYDTKVCIDGERIVLEPTHSYIAGDLNGDYNITIADLLLMSRYLIKSNVPRYPENADTDMDGVIDCYDMIALRKIIGGKYE